ncbi:hypothetical protein MMC13_005933 [Lambiella insularis]|nr:hypothetical protein [Lambiella insularis]
MILTKDPDSKYLYHQTEQQTSSRNLAVTSMRADMQYENPYLPICDTVGYPCKTDTKYRLPASPPASPSTQSARPKYCALQGLPAKIRHSSDLLNHSQEYRQALFLNWVAYERLFDDRILREERLRCPLLWCRKHFGDPRQLSEHVKNCERLSEGEYWCPQHQSPERWAAAPASKKHRSSLKLSICLKHAVRIIRRLGSRRPKKTSSIELEAHHTYQQAPANYMLITTNKDITTEQCEAELSTRSCELKIELPTTISRCYELQSPLTCHGSDLPFGAIIDVDMDMGTVESESSTSAASLSVSPIEDDYDIIDSEASSPMSPCYTIDATTRLLSFDEEDLGSRLCSPVFVPIPNLDLDLESQHEPASRNGLLEACPQNGFSFVLMQADLNKRSDAPPPLPIETRSHHDAEYSDEKELCSINYDAQSPPQSDCNALTAQPDRSHPALTATAMYDHDHGTGTDFHMHNQHDLVEGLRRVSPMLYKRSLRNLRRDAMTPAVQSFVDSMPSTEVIIERGLASLRKVFSGNLPNQIMEIYAMLHVAFVVAIVINQKDVAEVQKDLYADILNWSLAIRSVNERALFVHIAQRMWASEHSKLHCPRFVNDDLPGMLNQTCFTSVLPAISELPAPCSSTTNNPKTSTSSSTISNDTNVLLHALKKGGTAIYLCRQYLDVLEYTGLLASARGHDLQQMRGCLNRTPSEEVTNTAQNWETMVTRPLIEFMGLEGFRSIVINVQKLLANGIFENLREAELKLMFDAQIVQQLLFALQESSQGAWPERFSVQYEGAADTITSENFAILGISNIALTMSAMRRTLHRNLSQDEPDPAPQDYMYPP